jgi:hypothetical protein
MIPRGATVVVTETWRLKTQFEGDALRLMQQMDDLLGPAAHEHPGWCGHARFFQHAERRGEILMVYPWKSRALHEDLLAREEPILRGFEMHYCRAPRAIDYHHELPVEVDAAR